MSKYYENFIVSFFHRKLIMHLQNNMNEENKAVFCVVALSDGVICFPSFEHTYRLLPRDYEPIHGLVAQTMKGFCIYTHTHIHTHVYIHMYIIYIYISSHSVSLSNCLKARNQTKTSLYQLFPSKRRTAVKIFWTLACVKVILFITNNYVLSLKLGFNHMRYCRSNFYHGLVYLQNFDLPYLRVNHKTNIFCQKLLLLFLLLAFYNPRAGFSLLILEVSRSHTMTQHSR